MRRAAAALSVLLAAAPAASAELAGVSLPDTAEASGTTLVLNGLGLREATALKVDVYVAGLYVETKSSEPEPILTPTAAKRVVMRFVRSVGKDDLQKAWTEGFHKSAKGKDAGLDQLNAAMADVKKGDEIALTYLPATGVTVTVKGRDAATIPGEDFQRALFSIWLGPDPPNAGLREGMLGRPSR
jgi:hypothetical protein